eukprot:403350413
MPSHSGNYINQDFKALLHQGNVYGVSRAHKAFQNVQGLEFQDGLIGDLGQFYHDTFNSKLTLYLQNGSASANHIISLCLSGKNVLIQGNSHISVHSGLQLAGSKTFYIQPEYNSEFDIFLPINSQQIKDVIDTYPEIEAIYLTNPTIDGLCFNVQEVKNMIGEDRILIVDESYGTHFIFSDQCPISSLNQGADVCINRVDASLGSMTGTAILNISKQSKIDVTKLKQVYFMMGLSASVNPLMIADLEGCIKTFSQEGVQMIDNSIKNVHKLKSFIQQNAAKLQCLDFNYLLSDPTKLLIKVTGLQGKKLFKKLLNKKVLCERVTQSSVLLNIHTQTTENDIDFLIDSLRDIISNISISQIQSNPEIQVSQQSAQTQNQLFKSILNQRELVMDIRDCFANDQETIPILDAIGRVSAEIKFKNPECIPVLLQGERIQENHVKLLKSSKEMIRVIVQ